MRALRTTAVSLVFFFISGNVHTTPPSWPALEMDGSITIQGDIAVNAEVDIIFRFNVRPEGYLYNFLQHQKEAQKRALNVQSDSSEFILNQNLLHTVDTAYLLSDTSIEFLSPAGWSGTLIPGEQMEIRVRARFRNNYERVVRGAVGAFCSFSSTDTVQSQLPCITCNIFQSAALFKGNFPKATPDSTGSVNRKSGNETIIKQIYQLEPPPGTKDLKLQRDNKKPPKRDTTTSEHSEQGNKSSNKLSQIDYYSVSGNFYYVDIFGDTIPSKNTSIYVYYYDNGWIYDFSTDTDDNGYFYFVTDKDHIKALNSPINIATTVFTTSSHVLEDGATIQYYLFGVEISNPTFVDIVVPIEYTVNTQFPATFYIAEWIRNGFYSFFSYTSLVPSPVWVFWDSLNTQYATSFFGGFYVDGTPIIYINNKDGSDKNWDEWDEPVILHEYGHYLIWSYGQPSPYAFGGHSFLFPPNDTTIGGTANRPLDLVFNESLANILQGVLRDTEIYTDSIHDSMLFLSDFERPLPDAPFVIYYYGPSSQFPYWEGAHIEGAINAALWDLFDAVDDSNFYIGSTLYGHNDDSNTSEWWVGFDAIWDVLMTFDPQPDNPDHERCWNAYEFIHGWRKKGYPVDSTFINIFEAHNVPVFIPGDVDDLIGVNVGDLTFLVNFIFFGGPPPPHLSAADADASCAVNVGDLTDLIDYLFFDGAEPLVGCVDLY